MENKTWCAYHSCFKIEVRDPYTTETHHVCIHCAEEQLEGDDEEQSTHLDDD